MIAPQTPASGYLVYKDDADGKLYALYQDGTKTQLAPAGAGSGNTIKFGTTGSLPGSGTNSGDTYFPTDSLIDRYTWDGAVWQPFVQSLNVTTPHIADFGTSVTGSNVTVDSFSNINGGIIFSCHKTGGIDNVALKLKTFTAGKTYTMRCYNNIPGVVTNPWVGIAARDSVSSKFYMWGPAYKSGSVLWGGHWTNENSFSGSDYNAAANQSFWGIRGPISVRFVDDGSNYKMDAALDGVNWENYFTVAHGSAFLTPNQIGLAILSYSTTQQTEMTVCDFFQT